MPKIITIKNNKLAGFTDNQDLDLEKLRLIKERDGAKCYEITDEQYKQISDGKIPSVVDGGVIVT